MKDVSVEIAFYEGSEDEIVRFDVDGEYQIITYDDLREYIPRICLDAVDFVWFDIFGEYAIGYISLAEGRGTRVIGWSLTDNELVHISYAPHVQKIILEENMLYMLCDVSDHGEDRHLEVNTCEFGILDQDYIYDNIFFRLEPDYDEYDNDDFWLKKVGKKIIAGYKEISGECFIS